MAHAAQLYFNQSRGSTSNVIARRCVLGKDT